MTLQRPPTDDRSRDTAHRNASVRLTAKWLHSGPLRAVFDAFAQHGSEVRVVGGAVRNALLDLAVTDIDLATPLRPDAVMALARARGFGVHPTGISHGTVTVVANGQPFEITTLRQDIETTGRHASIAFTSDWVADAARRDFTINALYADADGNVIDHVGGLDDVQHRRVRFIGDAETRIHEDYLRILRFFRFTATYSEDEPDRDGLQAASALKAGLKKLSAERVRSELLKILQAPRACEIMAIMRDASITTTLFESDVDIERFRRAIAIEDASRSPVDPINRLAALVVDNDDDASKIASQLRLSSAESAALLAATAGAAQSASMSSKHDMHALIYRQGNDAATRAVLSAWTRSTSRSTPGHIASVTDADWLKRLEIARTWSAPQLPISGRDIMQLGVPAGPRIGKILEDFEAWWIENKFPDDRELVQSQLLKALAAPPQNPSSDR